MASSTTLQGPRDDNIVPLLHLTVFLCVAMSVMLFVEKVIILVKLFRKRPGRHPERQYIWDPIREKDEILVQIPVYNEKEVYQLSIGAACRVSWTSDRIIIQVLDDSTDSVIKERNKEKEVMEDENERNQEEETRTTEEKEDENERNQQEEIRTTEEKGDENERNQEEEIRTTEDENERNQEEEIRTTEEQKRRKRGGDTLGERKSQAKRRKIAEDDERRKKRKQQCRWVRSCMAMGCAAIFTSALIYLCAANIPEEEMIYLVPT